MIAVGLICLAWTVLMIWGAVWALTGRSRVLLLVGGSIAAVVIFLGCRDLLTDTTTDYGTASGYTFGIVLTLAFFLASLAIVVPLSGVRRRSSSPPTAPAGVAEPGHKQVAEPPRPVRRPYTPPPVRHSGGVDV